MDVDQISWSCDGQTVGDVFVGELHAILDGQDPLCTGFCCESWIHTAIDFVLHTKPIIPKFDLQPPTVTYQPPTPDQLPQIMGAISDHSVRSWDAWSGRPRHSPLRLHTSTVHVLEGHPWNPRVAMSAGYDGQVGVDEVWTKASSGSDVDAGEM